MTLTVLLVIVGLINAVPGLAAVVPGAIGRAYGVDAGDRDVATLLRHRAVLLFLVGAALTAGAFIEPLRDAAMIGGAVSMISYAALVFGGAANRRLRVVAVVDVGALGLLAVAVCLRLAA
ncbi:phosphopantetheine adenylyltransferase [Gordonia sp. TBRC 11910]|uniref:Phosphopantetheine adenylyltransferase n=1 Tax=Gordonia asplenii TaxID=2725283 RepID=A0A848KRP1_9ACTN|nr:phosphopantetheine adenylyltransferase [Gordonia asplenii]NMO01356.1 phosphopantetheine adenylyltransferase [Gordonia asplenii]